MRISQFIYLSSSSINIRKELLSRSKQTSPPGGHRNPEWKTTCLIWAFVLLNLSLGSLFRSLNFLSRSVVFFVMLSIVLSSSIFQEHEMEDTKWRLLPTAMIHCGSRFLWFNDQKNGVWVLTAQL